MKSKLRARYLALGALFVAVVVLLAVGSATVSKVEREHWSQTAADMSHTMDDYAAQVQAVILSHSKDLDNLRQLPPLVAMVRQTPPRSQPVVPVEGDRPLETQLQRLFEGYLSTRPNIDSVRLVVSGLPSLQRVAAVREVESSVIATPPPAPSPPGIPDLREVWNQAGDAVWVHLEQASMAADHAAGTAPAGRVWFAKPLHNANGRPWGLILLSGRADRLFGLAVDPVGFAESVQMAVGAGSLPDLVPQPGELHRRYPQAPAGVELAQEAATGAWWITRSRAVGLSSEQINGPLQLYGFMPLDTWVQQTRQAAYPPLLVLLVVWVLAVATILMGWMLWLLRQRGQQMRRESQRLNEALAAETQAKALFHTMFEQAPVGAALIETETCRLLEANKRFERIAYGKGDMPPLADGDEWLCLFDPADLGPLLAYRDALLQGYFTTLEGFGQQSQLQRPDGSQVTVRVKVTPVADPSVGAMRCLVVLEDVTQDELLKQRADELMTRLRLATEASGLGVWHWDLASGQVEWDDRMHRLYASPREVVETGATYDFWRSRVHPDDLARAEQELSNAVASGCYHNEFRIVLDDGSLRYVRADGVVRRDASGQPVSLLGIDLEMTNQKLQESELRLANEAKSMFLANMSHEIRTPMNAIIGLLGVLLDTPLNASQTRYLSKVQHAAHSLLRIIDDILDYSRFESGRVNMENRPFLLDALAVQVMSLFGAAAEKKGLEMVLDIPMELHRSYRGDAMRLGQVLNNLLSNALKFTPQGCLQLKVTSEGVTDQLERLRFEVSDSGIGITPVERERLFKPFSQADYSTTRRFGGTGLGLSICKQIVSQMGGEIGLDSVPGQGSTFWFTVMLEPEPTDHSILHVQREPLREEQALVVEDHPAQLRLLQRHLTDWAIKADGADSAEAAYEIIRAASRRGKPYTLLLLDWMLPKANGLWLLKQLQADFRGGKLPTLPKVIVLSASDPMALTAEANRDGLMPDGVLQKPVSPGRLYDAVADVQQRGQVGKSDAIVLPRGVSPYQLTGPIRGHHVLVVEDTPTNQEVALIMLGKMGLTADVANNGREGLDKLAQHHYDLVLMDLHMPVMNGLDATRAIRAGSWGSMLPVVAMTAAAFPEDRQQAFQAGMNDFVTKPLDPADLVQVLLRWLPHRAPSSENEAAAAPDAGAARDLEQDDTQATAAAKTAEPVRAASLPTLYGFDLATTLARVGGEADIVSRLLSRFADDFTPWLAEAQQGLTDADWKLLHRMAHTLKGASAAVGASQVQAAAGELETALKPHASGGAAASDPSTDVARLLAACAPPLQQAIRQIQAAAPETATNPVPSASTAAGGNAARAAATLSEVKRLVADRRRVPAPLLQRLNADLLAVGPDTQAGVQALQAALNQFNFAKALEALHQLQARSH